MSGNSIPPDYNLMCSRDRFRTMVNVMGDALATGIMAHICRKDFVKEGEEVRYGQSVRLARSVLSIPMPSSKNK